MDAHLPTIPWNTPALWQEANACLTTALQGNRNSLHVAHRCAEQLRRLLERTFLIMESLGRQTCPACTDVCCQRAWVWIDFKDLLFLHLADIALPKGQLLQCRGDRCRYAGPTGCRLERIQRPFVCTWYLCPEQSRILDRQPTEKKNLSKILDQMKSHRSKMEEAFIQAMASATINIPIVVRPSHKQ